MTLHCAQLFLLLSPLLSVIMRTTSSNTAGPLKDLWSETESWEQTCKKKIRHTLSSSHSVSYLTHIYTQTEIRGSSLGNGDFPGHRVHERVSWSESQT